jgi:cell surface protein SprA
MQVGLQYIVEKLTTNVTLRNGKTEAVTWYQFKIPLKSNDTKRVGTIRNFKSIRFARLYLTGSEKEMHLRFGSLDLVRGEWRNYNQGLYRNERTKNYNDNSPTGTALMDVQNVNIEENGNRSPVNYILPPGISRQTDPGQAQLIAQNEQAMVLRVRGLSPHDARAMYKNTGYDIRQYKNLQMFVHAEQLHLHLVGIAHHSALEVVAAAGNARYLVGDIAARAALGSGESQALLTQALAQYLGQALVAVGDDVAAQDFMQLA